MITGTSYFPNTNAAAMYYRTQLQTTYDEAVKIVSEKIQNSEIHIGKPVLRAGQKLFVRDNRYFIEEAN